MTAIVLAMALVSAWTPEAAIRDYLVQSYPWPEIEVKQVVAEAGLPKSRPVEVLTERGPLGRASFILRFAGEREVRVRAYVTARDRVVRTKRPLYRGTVIRSTDVYTAMMDVRRIPKGAISDPKSVTGMVLKRSLPADTTLTEAVAREKPLIRKGQRITIMYETPSLRVTAPGVAREDGYPEREISVMNLTSRKTITGIVDGRGVVSVRP